MGAQQIQRCAFAEQLWHQHFQATGEHIGGDIEPGLVGDACTRNGPQPNDIGIVAEAIAADRQADLAFAIVETPVVMDPALIWMRA